MNNQDIIGKVVRHEGNLYQILSVTDNIVFAHSYGKDHGINETVLISKSTMKIIAKKSKSRGEK